MRCLQSDAVYCSLRQCSAVHYTAMSWSALQCLAVHCTALQWIAACWQTIDPLFCEKSSCPDKHGCLLNSTVFVTSLHCTALHCNAHYCTALYCTALHCTAMYCATLHCTALHCSALHCTVLHCTPRHLLTPKTRHTSEIIPHCWQYIKFIILQWLVFTGSIKLAF